MVTGGPVSRYVERPLVGERFAHRHIGVFARADFAAVDRQQSVARFDAVVMGRGMLIDGKHAGFTFRIGGKRYSVHLAAFDLHGRAACTRAACLPER